MVDAARTTMTLAVLGALVLLAAVWGWNAATEPLPAKVDSAVCVDTAVEAGSQLYPQQVTVSIYNGGRRDGLAGRTMRLFVDAGFAEGTSGNAASAKVRKVAIWTTEPESPAVQLVAGYLPDDAEIERRDGIGAGITIVVGDDYTTTRLAKGEKSVAVESDTEVCSPPVG
ncbi:LytR C-terminal domain-containing protein [Nocardioides sp. YIM 152315]|uniref:LytR C-terminal domain-containing protein n=1 Tax=Nocardioides sp. YIM 152315 TaxID=3031760 RepID=UPI0023D99E4D|nr:LytR C-terminal domain-containing protein [Nocardioides sp. YIM 152315]MDF1605255.1 LytR C-terminal domain-containing protein [Nocardioides sp. YIM 152315]